MYVQLLSYSSGEQQVMATVRVVGNQLQIEGRVPERVRQDLLTAQEETASPEAFLRSLPLVFSGAYLRAKFFDSDLSQALKGGPGSGRYPKGSTANTPGTAKAPPASVLRTMGQPDGGFTYSPTTGRQPHTGFALSVHPDRGQVLDSKQANVVHLAKFVKKNWDLLKLKGNFIGGWHHPKNGKVYLDVSTVVKTKEEAFRLGKEAKQIAYFDLEKGKSVKILGMPIPKAYRTALKGEHGC